MLTRKPENLRSFTLLGLLALAAVSGCGPHKKGADTRNLSQKSEDLGDAGYYLCREDFAYVIQQTGSQTPVSSHSFLVAASEKGRISTKKQILEACTSPSTVTDKLESLACASPTALSSIACIHENLMAYPFTPPAGKGVLCTLNYAYAYEGRQLSDYTDKIESSVLTTVSLAVRDVAAQCADLKRPGVQRDGCSRALLDGKLSCVAK